MALESPVKIPADAGGPESGPERGRFQRVQELAIEAWYDCFVRLQSDEDAKNSATKWTLTNDELGVLLSSVGFVSTTEL